MPVRIKKQVEFIMTFLCSKCGMQFRDTKEEAKSRGWKCKVCSGESWITGY